MPPSLLTALRNQGGPPVPMPGSGSGSVIGSIFGGTGRGMEPLMGTMGAVGTLFAIVDALSNGTAGQEWHLYLNSAKPGSLDRTEVFSHAALDLWNHPNEYYTQQELVESGQQHQELVGETWLLVKWSGNDANGNGTGVPLELWCIRPDRMEPVPDPDNFLAGYLYTGPNGEKIPLAKNEVIMLRRPNPLDPYRGMGAVQTVLADLDSIKYSAEWNRNFFINSATPGGIILAPTNMGDPEYNKLRQRWSENHRGVARAHRVAILEGGMTWVERSYSVRDMQFSQLREVNREVVREAFRFPLPMLGTTENVNRANADAAETVFARWLLVQRLNRWKQALNFELLPMFGKAIIGRYAFDYDSPIPADDLTEAQQLNLNVTAAVQLINAGVAASDAFATCDLPEMAMAAAGVEDEKTGKLDPQALAQLAATLSTPANVVVSPDEARELLTLAGWDLSEPYEAPAPPAPPPPPAPLPGPPANHLHVEVKPGYIASELARRRAWLGLPDYPVNANPPPIPESDQPDFGANQEDWKRAVAEAMSKWPGITEAWIDQLVDDVETAVKDDDLVAMSQLSMSAHNINQAKDLIAGYMDMVADQESQRAADEGNDQGVTVTPVNADNDVIQDVAETTAGLLAAGYALSAGTEALRVKGPHSTAAEVAAKVRDHLKSLTGAQAQLSIGAAMTGAQNLGRIATLTSSLNPSCALYAAEQNDVNTCDPCRQINGRWLGNSDDMGQVELSYPGGGYGGYVDCLGGGRCRGTIFGVYRPDQVDGST